MATDLRDKLVLITGGGGTIGYEIANAYLQNGARVALLDIKEEKGIEVAKNLNSIHGKDKAVFFKCDVTSHVHETPDEVQSTLGKIDIFINCSVVLDELKRVESLDVNVTSMIEWCLRLWNLMRVDKGGNGGTIILLASTDGFRVNRFLPTYQCANTATISFAKSLGHKYHYDRTGVRVVALCPGLTESEFWANPRTMVDKQWHDGGWMQPEFLEYLKSQPWQGADVVGRAAVEVFEKADSGSVWIVEGGKPVEELK